MKLSYRERNRIETSLYHFNQGNIKLEDLVRDIRGILDGDMKFFEIKQEWEALGYEVEVDLEAIPPRITARSQEEHHDITIVISDKMYKASWKTFEGGPSTAANVRAEELRVLGATMRLLETLDERDFLTPAGIALMDAGFKAVEKNVYKNNYDEILQFDESPLTYKLYSLGGYEHESVEISEELHEVISMKLKELKKGLNNAKNKKDNEVEEKG